VTPLPNIPLAIAEAAYAIDELGAEGVVVESNHHGLYHGDPKLDPFYGELNPRRAAMFIHPSSPLCEGCLTSALGYAQPMLEFMFETTRAIAYLVQCGFTQRFPDIRIIVPHAGPALSVLASRVDGFTSMMPRPSGAPPKLAIELPKLYFDLAGMPLPVQLKALLQIAPTEHISMAVTGPSPRKLFGREPRSRARQLGRHLFRAAKGVDVRKCFATVPEVPRLFWASFAKAIAISLRSHHRNKVDHMTK
jgi:predicted TIM-barrel fold metal-dependent hydrolase